MRRASQNAKRTEKLIARLMTMFAAMIVGHIARASLPESTSEIALKTAATPSAKTSVQAWPIHQGPTRGAP